MYIQITSRCNMTCAHCGMNCTHEGEDMTLETLKKVLNLGLDNTYIIGGGEPTIHPDFWQMFGLILGHSDMYTWMATNGSMTGIAIALSGLAKGSDRLGVALSQDSYHDPINWSVVEAFERDGNEIRNVTGIEVKSGRCDWGDESRCICDELFVKPNGDIHMCGCLDSLKIGDCDEGIYPGYSHIPGGICHQEYEDEQKDSDYEDAA